MLQAMFIKIPNYTNIRNPLVTLYYFVDQRDQGQHCNNQELAIRDDAELTLVSSKEKDGAL